MRGCLPSDPSFLRGLRLLLAVVLVAIALPFPSLRAATLLPPSRCPSDIGESDWQRLFGEKPQVIAAHLVTSRGVSCYEVVDWDPTPPGCGLGGTSTYVLVKDGVVSVPWRYEAFGHEAPAWVSLGLTEGEAIGMVKQYWEKCIRCSGLKNVRKEIRGKYEELARVADAMSDLEFCFPETIGAFRELGLLPKNFVPPSLSPEAQRSLNLLLGKERASRRYPTEVSREISAKLIERMRAYAQGDREAAEKLTQEIRALRERSASPAAPAHPAASGKPDSGASPLTLPSGANEKGGS